MSFNSFGEALQITTFGESHGPAVGVVIDGVMPGMDLDLSAVQRDLDRRRPGVSSVTTSRSELDRVKVLSGVFEGKTTGTPICLLVENQGAHSKDYERLANVFRPGHADFGYWKKYGIRDHRGGGRASGRETVARVAAGGVARIILAEEGIEVSGFVREVAGVRAETVKLGQIEDNDLRCPDPSAVEPMRQAILAARAEGDSVGGIVEVHATGVPAGLGDPVFAKLDAQLAAALMSIGAVKGVEIGDGFELARRRGSESNDQAGSEGFLTNHLGGILGGISSGQDLILRLAVKPTPSIAKVQTAQDSKGELVELSVGGRHDPCICPRLVPVAEAMVALVIADALLRQRAIEGVKRSAAESKLALERLDRTIIEAVAARRELAIASDAVETVQHGREEDVRHRIGLNYGLERSLVDELFRCIEKRGGNADGHR